MLTGILENRESSWKLPETCETFLFRAAFKPLIKIGDNSEPCFFRTITLVIFEPISFLGFWLIWKLTSWERPKRLVELSYWKVNFIGGMESMNGCNLSRSSGKYRSTNNNVLRRTSQSQGTCIFPITADISTRL